MKVSQGTDVCYNVQTVVDAKHKLIVEHEVTNEPTDHAQLSKMALRAKQVLEVERARGSSRSRILRWSRSKEVRASRDNSLCSKAADISQ